VATAAAAGFQRQIKVMIELEPGTNNIPEDIPKARRTPSLILARGKALQPNAGAVRKFLVEEG
jgi:hypothetical protein